jgi:hypothetical protein
VAGTFDTETVVAESDLYGSAVIYPYLRLYGAGEKGKKASYDEEEIRPRHVHFWSGGENQVMGEEGSVVDGEKNAEVEVYHLF